MSESKEHNELLSSVALLVLDVQDCFLDTLSDRRGFLTRCAFAIDAATRLGMRVLFSEQVPDKLGHTHEKLLRRVRNPKVFHKTSFSALNAPGMERYLRDNEIYHLLVCGLETPICVYQTGLQSSNEDIDVTFLTDALGARRPDDAAFALEALRSLGCQLLPSETVFYSLIQEATHPGFRAFSQLVKDFSQDDFDIEAYLDQAPGFAPMPEGRLGEASRKRRSRSQRRSRKRRPEEEAPGEAARKETPQNRPDATTAAEPVAPQSADKPASESEKRPARKPRSAPKGKGSSHEAPPSSTSPAAAQTEPRNAVKKTAQEEASPKPAAKKAAKKSARKVARKTVSKTEDQS